MSLLPDQMCIKGNGQFSENELHSKKCNVRLPYVKHALNVRNKTYVKRMVRAPYVYRMFFTIRYSCVLENMRLTHGI